MKPPIHRIYLRMFTCLTSVCLFLACLITSKDAHALLDPANRQQLKTLVNDIKHETEALSPIPLNKRVNIMILADETMSMSAAGLRLKKLFKNSPGINAIYQVKSPSDIRLALETAPGEVIQSILFYGLHYSLRNGTHSFAVRYWDKALVYYPVKIEDLRPLNRRVFMPGAFISFDSCHLAPQNESDAKTFLEELSRVLGLKSGYIYANASYGVAHPYNLSLTPFYEGKGFFSFVRFLAAAFPWISQPVDWGLYYWFNSGYLYGRADSTGASVIWKTNLRDVEDKSFAQ